jgi:hypothetical protein
MRHGDVIVDYNQEVLYGTVGAFMTSGRDLYAITASHVTEHCPIPIRPSQYPTDTKPTQLAPFKIHERDLKRVRTVEGLRD